MNTGSAPARKARASTRADHGYGKPNASVDVVILTLLDGKLHVCLIERDKDPFLGSLALPGGYVHVDEDLGLTDVALRMLKTKTGLQPRFLEQLQTFGGADRDPDGWSITVAYFTMLNPQEAEATTAVHIVPVDHLPALAFDHARIVQAAVGRLRSKSTYSALPAYLLPPEFTIPELQSVYEQVIGTTLDKKSFRRKIDEQEIIEPSGRERRDGPHRPSQLYRLKPGVAPEFDRRI